jgi:hypothetical protein
MSEAISKDLIIEMRVVQAGMRQLSERLNSVIGVTDRDVEWRLKAVEIGGASDIMDSWIEQIKKEISNEEK